MSTVENPAFLGESQRLRGKDEGAKRQHGRKHWDRKNQQHVGARCWTEKVYASTKCGALVVKESPNPSGARGYVGHELLPGRERLLSTWMDTVCLTLKDDTAVQIRKPGGIASGCRQVLWRLSDLEKAIPMNT